MGFIVYPALDIKDWIHKEILHPLTTIEVGDLDGAREVARKLRSERFYKLCSDTIKKRFDMYYTEEAWKNNWRKTNGH